LIVKVREPFFISHSFGDCQQTRNIPIPWKRFLV
jgi:hypothetical protein